MNDYPCRKIDQMFFTLHLLHLTVSDELSCSGCPSRSCFSLQAHLPQIQPKIVALYCLEFYVSPQLSSRGFLLLQVRIKLCRTIEPIVLVLRELLSDEKDWFTSEPLSYHIPHCIAGIFRHTIILPFHSPWFFKKSALHDYYLPKKVCPCCSASFWRYH